MFPSFSSTEKARKPGNETAGKAGDEDMLVLHAHLCFFFRERKTSTIQAASMARCRLAREATLLRP